MRKFTLTLLGALLILSANSHATDTKKSKPQKPHTTQIKKSPSPIIYPARKIKLSAEEMAAEQKRYDGIVKHTEQVFSLLLAEIAANKGDMFTSMSIYLNQLRQTRNPNVAERAMELAISARAYNITDYIYQQWKELEPEPSPALRRLEWARALASNDYHTILNNMTTVLQEATPEQRGRMFLLLVQTSISHPNLAKKGKDNLYQLTQQYETLPEAAMLEALVSAENHDKKRLNAALSRLVQLDKDISAETILILQELAQKQPQMLSEFFTQNNQKNWSITWRKLELSVLIGAQKYHLAEKKIQTLLSENPDPSLYLQAARLAEYQKQNVNIIVGYFDKAYQIGTQEDKARAAFLAAMYLAQQKDYVQAQAWTEKINAPDFAFDRLVLQGLLAAEQENWQKVYDIAQKVFALSEQKGQVFSLAEIYQIYGNAILETQSPQEALKIFNKEIKNLENKNHQTDTQKNLSILLEYRGMLYNDKLGEPEKAIADMRRYFQLNHNSDIAMNNLGYTLLIADKKNINEAFNLIQRAFKLEPENAVINDSMGWAYYHKGNYATALLYLEYAYTKETNAEVGAHLGATLWQLGQQDKAYQIWQESKKLDSNNRFLRDILHDLGVTLP